MQASRGDHSTIYLRVLKHSTTSTSFRTHASTYGLPYVHMTFALMQNLYIYMYMYMYIEIRNGDLLLVYPQGQEVIIKQTHMNR